MSHPLYVLVVDDDRETADGLGRLVRQCGHRVAVTYGGDDALRLSGLHRPDVALLDLNLAQLDGLRLARLLTEPPGPPLLLVALTGHAGPGVHEHTYAAGFRFYLPKPVEPCELERLLTALAEVKAADLLQN